MNSYHIAIQDLKAEIDLSKEFDQNLMWRSRMQAAHTVT